ncbi:Rossmann-fold NAD(P)-binding domain-containing protein [Paramaledivibacter caminithermalis]|uniref:Alanine dehydrogenase n=1 Tax=Paramaledivibacter caminithermalis (strain DSM 15212 / CIP 107654 / DViRD3) TaxID=1121301 RepID=A0A1M6NV44_PARC5|nr:alanine dehydrogenase [Paramaledivibacter caminithermalis]SHJ99484.1 alanine dehydrogenase [Paramaledivibacter caminithermalis DSM 15212]
MKIKTMGFPRMTRKKGEKRDFLPELFKKLSNFKGIDILIEDGYGKGMGLTHEDYLNKNSNLKFTTHDDIYKQDLVIVLRAPNEEDIKIMKEGSILISMLHYDTRPLRNDLLKSRGIISYSMDSMVDDENNRMVVNYWGTSMTGAAVAFNKLKETMKYFYSEGRRPINVAIIGLGKVGINAARAFKRLSDKTFYNKKIPGVIIKILPKSITINTEALKYILKETDILVDASRRSDPSQIIVPNSLIYYMPKHSIILDLTADPYNDEVDPIQQKAVEGIPTGTLEKYMIYPEDDVYKTIPDKVDTTNRRIVASCNAWPGVHPRESMSTYGKQIYPFLKILLEKDPYSLDINSENLYERALVKSSLHYFMENLKN